MPSIILSIMVYYIRFLKSPRIQNQKPRSLSISALISVTTDLGDSFLAEDVDLLATLVLEDTDKVLCQKALNWKAGKRELPISLGPLPEFLSRQSVILVVSTIKSRRVEPPTEDNLLGNPTIPLVISGWSAPFGGSHPPAAEKLIGRRFGPMGKLDLRIWEETGNSIARHIW